MRTPSVAHLVGGAGCAVCAGLLCLATLAAAQDSPWPAPAGAGGGAAGSARPVLLPPVALEAAELPAGAGDSPSGTREPGRAWGLTAVPLLPATAAAPAADPSQAAPARPGEGPAPTPAAPETGPSLLELPLEKLAEQPVKIVVPEAPAPGVAAAAPAAAAPLTPPGPVVTAASRREEKVSAAPAGVVVISREEIVLRGYSQLTDVLRDLPGMETIEYYFSEFGTQVPVRGISGNNKIVVLVNGMRVNPPGGENFPFRSDFSVRFAERIEIIYGSGTVLYGQDAISCVINIVTREPGSGGGESPEGREADQLATTGASRVSVQMGADGGVNLERDAYGWVGGFLDGEHNIKAYGYVQYHDSDLTPLDKEYPFYWQDYRDVALPRTNANGITPHREDYGLNLFGRIEGYGTSIQYWHRESERSSAEGFQPFAPGNALTGLGGLGFVPQAIWADQSDVIEGKNTLRLTDRISLESTSTYNRYEIDPISRYVEPVIVPRTEWFLNDFKYGIGQQGRQEETVRVELPDRISLLAGVAVAYSDIIPKGTIPGGFQPGTSPVQQGGSFVYTDATGRHTIPRVTEETYWDYAPYVEGQWQLLDRLRLIGGTRVTWDDRFREVPITPRAAAVYNLTDQITVKYVYTEGFVAPAPYFSFATFDNGTLLATTNPNVAPEHSKEHDLLLTWARDNFSLTLNPYYGTQSGIITVADQDLPINVVEPQVFLNGNPNEPRMLVHTANGGISERVGVDVYGKGKLGPLSLWFSYSYVDFDENTQGNITRLLGISRHNGRLGATWTVTRKLFVTPSLVIRSTPEGVKPGKLSSDLDTPYEINLYGLYKYTEYAEFFLALRNITDNHYALGGFAGIPIPQETFHGVVGLQVRY